MSMPSITLTALAAGNMHACLYGALGAILLLRSFLMARDHQFDVAREDAVIGLVHIMLAIF